MFEISNFETQMIAKVFDVHELELFYFFYVEELKYYRANVAAPALSQRTDLQGH